jgi:hypothetical protein
MAKPIVATSAPAIPAPGGNYVELRFADCPLCRLYHPSPNGRNMCEGCSPSCPIKLATGKDWCKGSPYEHWADAFTEEEKEEAATAFARWLAELEASSSPRRGG